MKNLIRENLSLNYLNDETLNNNLKINLKNYKIYIGKDDSNNINISIYNNNDVNDFIYILFDDNINLLDIE